MSYYSQSKPPFIHSYHRPIINKMMNMKMVIWAWIFNLLVDIDHGNSNTISKSNIKNNIPTRKNLIEKGLLGLWNGVNPHSYIDNLFKYDFFSVSMNEILIIAIEIINDRIIKINKAYILFILMEY